MALLTVQNLNFAYPNSKTRALANIDFSIEEGEFILLCGESGCGKSTLLKHFKKELAPHGVRDGDVLFRSQSVLKMDGRDSATQIGFVMQNIDNQIVTDKVYSELAFGLESLGLANEVIRRRVAEMASFFGIHNWFRSDTARLSGGQKQMLNLASVMVMQPKLLILDEPTSQLDPIAAAEFLNTVVRINRGFGTTVILTEHRLEEIFPSADRVLVLDGGNLILDGAPQAAATRLAVGAHRHMIGEAFPAAIRLYAELGGDSPCPLTVRDGRNYVLGIKGGAAQNENVPVKDSKAQKAGAARQKNHTEPVVALREVFFRYEKNAPDVLKGLSLEVEKGELFCILGGNGAGKSTALSILGGLRRPYRGSVEVKGKKLSAYRAQELYGKTLSALPQNPLALFTAKTVRKELEQMTENASAIESIVLRLQLESLLDAHPYDLSGGEMQKVGFAKVLLCNPEIILLDEPTKGLDAHYKARFGALLGELCAEGKTVVMATHDVEFAARFATRCGLFFDGEITSAADPETFFSGNYFYTTAANRIARAAGSQAITVEQLATELRQL